MARAQKLKGKGGAVSWRYQVNRKGIRQSRVFPTKAEAERWGRAVEAAIDGDTYVDTSPAAHMTLGEVWDEYGEMKGLRWAETMKRDFRVARKSAEPLLAMPIQSINRKVVQEWVADMSNKYKPSTVENRFKHLRSVMIYAQGEHYTTVDATAKITLPRKTKRVEFPDLTSAHIEALVLAVQAQRGKLSVERSRVIRTLATTGLRWNEVAGLRVQDVEVYQKEDGSWVGDLSIVQGYTMVGSDPILIDLKTSSSRRHVPVAGKAAEEIAKQRDIAIKAGRTLMWVGPDGGPMRAPTSAGDWWGRARGSSIAAEAGVPSNLKLHDLRHATATRMIRAGVPITAVSRMLGHASPKITLDVYSHYVASDNDSILAAMLDAEG